MDKIKFAQLISFISARTSTYFSADDIAGVANLVNETIHDKVSLTPLFSLLINRRKIDAIKEYRALTGFGLKESKDAIEALMAEFKQPDNNGEG